MVAACGCYQGDFDAETRYAVDPAGAAAPLRRLGASWLHVVDLDGARDGVPRQPRDDRNARRRRRGATCRSAAACATRRCIEALLAAGVGARRHRQRRRRGSPRRSRGWLERYGAERLCLAFDVRLERRR